ncbi:MAG TPA: DUF1987 domain-containing protein [Bacteroidia bacterium]|nr:DUF1987 domain-containing protein [Bacteroidia bacterium]
MQPLFIAHTKITPRIVLDGGKGEFSITGRSIPADATVFYLPADRWVEKYLSNFDGKEISIDIKLDHLNTGSVRSILTILTRFLRLKSTGVKIGINWHYEAEDEDIHDKGEEMALILDQPFNFIPYKDF